MIGEQKQKDDSGCVTVSCKVPKWVADLLNLIAKSRNAVTNDILKMCIMFIIETAKLTTDPSPDMKVLLNMIQMDANWAKMFNYCSSGKMDVAQAILVLQQTDGNKPREGFGLAMFNKPFMGDCVQNMSKDEILERVVELTMGYDDYMKLRDIGKGMESGSMRETLSRMIDAQTIIDLDESNRQELPGYGDRHEYGKAIEYGQRTRRVRHRTPDSVANSQQTIRFTDYDRELADYEAQDWEGEHIGGHVSPDEIEDILGGKPFGVEP